MEKPNRKLIVFAIAQTILIIFFLTYALVQRTAALKNEEVAVEMSQKAMEVQKALEECSESIKK